MIYLDHNSTTRPTEAVRRAVGDALDRLWANPSSVHRAGQEARHAVELARQQIATLIGVGPKELVLTSGGTESIDLAVRGVVDAARARGGGEPPVVVTSPLEHAAVRDLVEHLERAEGVRVRWMPVTDAGVADVASLPALLDEGAALVSVQWANNETGVVQPVERIGEICRERGVPFHCDAVQWVGKVAVGSPLPCDLLTLSAHKFHGAKGVGALWVRRGVAAVPRLRGTQELDRRGGTENVSGIVGAGVAAAEAGAWLEDAAAGERLRALRDRFESEVLAGCPGAVVNGAGAERLWNTTNIGFPRLESEALLLLLSERGVCASAGAACSSGSLDPSPVLLSMGVPEEVAHGSLRFSIGRETTEREIVEGAAAVVGAVGQLSRSMRG